MNQQDRVGTGSADSTLYDIVRQSISFQSGNEILVGDLVLPAAPGPHPAMLNIAGTGSQNRDGDMVMPTGEVRGNGRHRWLANRLAQHGIASLCWDKRGVGESTGGNRQPGDPPGDRDAHASVMTDVDDAENALNFLTSRPEIDSRRIAVRGHSAGVYFSCLLAARTNLPAAYVLSGGVHMGIDEFMALIYDNVVRYAARGEAEKAWVKKYLLPFYQIALRYNEVLAAAHRGEDVYEDNENGVFIRQYLTRLKEELAYPLYDQFKHIKKPTLVIHGDKDINVPVQEAYKIAQTLETQGNKRVTLTIVPGADHGMLVAPYDLEDETRFRQKWERSTNYPFSEFFTHALIGWLIDQLTYL